MKSSPKSSGTTNGVTGGATVQEGLHRAPRPARTAPGKGGVNELNSPSNLTGGIRGTDLGVSFESEGWLYFLFGDSWVPGDGTLVCSREIVFPPDCRFLTTNDDSIAVTDARSVGRFRMPELKWAGDDDAFAPLRVGKAGRSCAATASPRDATGWRSWPAPRRLRSPPASSSCAGLRY
jgi:hypothetical protein